MSLAVTSGCASSWVSGGGSRRRRRDWGSMETSSSVWRACPLLLGPGRFSLPCWKTSGGGRLLGSGAEMFVLDEGRGAIGVGGSAEMDGDNIGWWELSSARTTFAGVPHWIQSVKDVLRPRISAIYGYLVEASYRWGGSKFSGMRL